MHPLAKSLGAAERDLLRETEDKRLAGLDEDALVDLHRRIRRARNKYVGIYRRTGAAAVSKKGGRGLAKKKNARNAGRAEVFEDALARVSAALASAAAAQAEELKAARLAAANPPGTWPGSQEAPPAPAAEPATEGGTDAPATQEATTDGAPTPTPAAKKAVPTRRAAVKKAAPAGAAEPATGSASGATSPKRAAPAKRATPAKKAAPTTRTAQVTDRTPTGPGREKRNASTRAQGTRRQAARDSR